jgi:DNA repair protein RadA
MAIVNKDLIQSYIMTTAKYDFNVYEKRIIYRLVEMAQGEVQGVKFANNCQKIEHDLFSCVNITMPIACLLNGEEDKNYARVKEALQSLQRKIFEYEDDEIWQSISIIALPYIRKRSSVLSFQVHPRVWDCILDFSKGYRKYELKAAKNAGMTMRHGGAATMFGGQHSEHDAAPMKLRDISAIDEPRIDMRDEELNRVLGGGMVPGSITLLGGEPGIGKSTLTLQTILNMTDRRILYVSGEESAHQIKLRADRLAKGQAMLRDGSSADTLKTASLSSEGAFDHITVLCETQLEKIFSHIQEVAPQLIVIDSIQTISTEEVDSSPGSVSQVRECAASLLRFAKTSGIPVILIGHINKEGTLAGPKILEHIVDTVIQFEGDQHYMYRILRSIKNRFGSTSELGIYEMMQGGLRQVSNPSELLLTEDHDGLSGVAKNS